MQEAPLLVPSKEDPALHTVLYKGRYLYSKYSPAKAIRTRIASLSVLPGTLILINSPALFYGLSELRARCPADCTFFALEADPALYALSKDTLNNTKQDISLFFTADTRTLDNALRTIVNTGKIKRVLSLDFSLGTAFAPEMYTNVFAAAQEITALFWKNRITLSKMGKLFAKNIFRNLKNLTDANQLCAVQKSVTLPILVCGAGESLDETLSPHNQMIVESLKHGDFYVIAVDAALSALLERGITVNAVVSLESQFAIQKAFLGTKNCGATLFLDLCARPQSKNGFEQNVIWFCSEYAPAQFLRQLHTQGIIRSLIPPLGSVGLSATYIALALRASNDVPIFLTGLDFSFTEAKTHARGVMAEKARLINTNRLSPPGSYSAAFSSLSNAVPTHSTQKMYTIPNLMQYAHSFTAHFSGKANMFNLSNGIPLGVPHITTDEIQKHIFPSTSNMQKDRTSAPVGFSPADFYQTEKNALLKLQNLLSFGEKSDFYDTTKPLSLQIKEIFIERDYLFLHFPDGFLPTTETSFLKRIRAETDFFLKQISLATR